MSISTILVGKEINYNAIFKAYILRHIKNTTQDISTILEINDYYKVDMLDIIKEQKSSQIYIFTSNSSFNLLGKVISSHLKCSTIIKDDFLIPEIFISFDSGSYVIEIFGKQVNVVSCEHKRKLPPILLKQKNIQKKFHIFGFDVDMLNIILEPIASMYNISFDIQEVVPKWHILYINTDFSDIQNFIQASKKLLSHQVILEDDVVPYIIKTFNKRNIYITCAESCTGGLLSSYFTKYPSISDIFELGIVSYSNEIKSDILDVSKDNLFKKGAVSQEVVNDMIKGMLKKSMADYAIAISGIAGPSGGSDSKPVGSVYIGVGDKKNVKIKLYNFDGDREYIQEQSKFMAIKMLVLFAKHDLF
ncbi:Molybdopterin binding motif, CinA N-terminal domain / C-terminal domain of CinA type S [hydrothermal vent metagenome]|uniref:Molybdopterin binding motif, CinA N-terminal domain / C-terminal domain of CinA type S n=1 Tax=hydrothermal vent metagenome TaxID=652676 RepID=A0A3B1EA61_9ZZZZ